MAIRTFHRDEPDLLMPMIAEDARLIVWPGVNAHSANMNYVDMQPGERNTPHFHRVSEDTLFVLDGKGTITDFDHDLVLPFEAGQVVHVPVGVRHAVAGDRDSRIESVGGPCPADLDMLRAVGALKDEG